MAYPRNIKGAVLIPVLLLAGIIALGIIVLLQTQIIQKKSIADFKQYLKNKRQEEKYDAYLNSLSIESLLALKNIKLKQKIPQNIHYQNNQNYHYYFQLNDHQYIYKLATSNQDISFPELAFDCAGTTLEIIQIKQEEGILFCLYDKNSGKMFFQNSFKNMPTFQLVGNPVNSIYFYDHKKLYKLGLNFIESATLKVLKNNESEVVESDGFPELLITRDAKGDGRLIYLSQNNQPSVLIFHEALPMKHEYLDLFEHY